MAKIVISTCSARDLVLSLGWEDPLENEMAIHSSILSWTIPWTEEPEGYHRVAKSQTQLNDFAHRKISLNSIPPESSSSTESHISGKKKSKRIQAID